jgi:hypothetical protein
MYQIYDDFDTFCIKLNKSVTPFIYFVHQSFKNLENFLGSSKIKKSFLEIT